METKKSANILEAIRHSLCVMTSVYDQLWMDADGQTKEPSSLTTHPILDLTEPPHAVRFGHFKAAQTLAAPGMRITYAPVLSAQAVTNVPRGTFNLAA
jgi:hypothetical protein